MSALLDDERRDALQEISNIAMGQAGASLAKLLGVFVKLSVPRINVIDISAVNRTLAGMIGADTRVTAVRQAYSGALSGEAIAIFNDEGAADLADLLCYDDALTSRDEILLDTANLLIGASMSGIAGLLGSGIGFGAPSVMARDTPVCDLMPPATQEWTYALMVEVNFRLEARRFTCHLAQFMPEPSIAPLQRSLDTFLASMA